MTDELRPGDYVKMINCYEAKLNPDKVWVVRSEPWELGHGEKVVLLEGKAGGFLCDCLKLCIKSNEPDSMITSIIFKLDDFKPCPICNSKMEYSMIGAMHKIRFKISCSTSDEAEIQLICPVCGLMSRMFTFNNDSIESMKQSWNARNGVI